MAIVHASQMPLYKIDERGREICRQLIEDERSMKKWQREQAESNTQLRNPLIYPNSIRVSLQAPFRPPSLLHDSEYSQQLKVVYDPPPSDGALCGRRPERGQTGRSGSVEERRKRIVDGEKSGLQSDLDEG
jgi:hypothetical protein